MSSTVPRDELELCASSNPLSGRQRPTGSKSVIEGLGDEVLRPKLHQLVISVLEIVFLVPFETEFVTVS